MMTRKESSLYEEKTAATRRLHEMNPDHPYILHELAIAILPQHPEEALRYAKKAQQLEYRYRWEGIDGMCYFQLGDYEKALTAFERADAAAEGSIQASVFRQYKIRETYYGQPRIAKKVSKVARGEQKTRYVYHNALLNETINYELLNILCFCDLLIRRI